MRMMTACLILFFVLPAFAGEDVTRLPMTEADIPTGEDWFGVYMNGRKKGYARMIVSKDEEHYTVKMNMKVTMTAMGQTVTIKVTDEAHFGLEAPYVYVGGHLRMGGGGRDQFTVARIKDGEVVASVTTAGQTRTLKSPQPDFTLADGIAQNLWLMQPRAAGDKFTARAFDLMTLQPSTQTITIKSVEETVARGVPVRHYQLDLVSSVMGPVGTMRVTEKGEMLVFTFGGMFEMRREPKDIAKKIEEGGDIFVDSFVKLDKPLGDPKKVTELVVVVTGEGRDMVRSGPGQDAVSHPELGRVVVSIGDRFGAAVKATPEEIADNLRETVEFPTRDERIAALAKMAVADAGTDREKVDLLVHFVAQYVNDTLRPEPVSVLEVLESKHGDCAEHSILFATMARNLGIPTRVVTGLVYVGDAVQALGGHAWNEVVIDGHWVPVDSTWDETKLNATHIRIGSGLRGLTSIGWTLGRVKLEVVSVQR